MDASRTGFRGHSSPSNFDSAAGLFSVKEQLTGSTERELLAIYYVLMSYCKDLTSKKVKIYSDNQGACRIISVGSRKPHLQKIAIDIFKISVKHNFILNAQWISRTENGKADLLSKFIDMNDWQISPTTFMLMDAKWGPHKVDRFTSHYNFQVSRFNSRFTCPMSEAINAFMQDLSHDNNWVCPHPSTMKSCKARGTLIVSEWPFTIFWPLLCDTPKKFAFFIEEVFVLSKINCKIKDLIIESPGQKEVYKSKPSAFSGCPSFNILAMKINFSS